MATESRNREIVSKSQGITSQNQSSLLVLDFPNEVLHHIFSFIDNLKDLKSAMCVNRSLRSFVLDNTRRLHLGTNDRQTVSIPLKWYTQFTQLLRIDGPVPVNKSDNLTLFGSLGQLSRVSFQFIDSDLENSLIQISMLMLEKYRRGSLNPHEPNDCTLTFYLSTGECRNCVIYDQDKMFVEINGYSASLGLLVQTMIDLGRLKALNLSTEIGTIFPLLLISGPPTITITHYSISLIRLRNVIDDLLVSLNLSTSILKIKLSFLYPSLDALRTIENSISDFLRRSTIPDSREFECHLPIRVDEIPLLRRRYPNLRTIGFREGQSPEEIAEMLETLESILKSEIKKVIIFSTRSERERIEYKTIERSLAKLVDPKKVTFRRFYI